MLLESLVLLIFKVWIAGPSECGEERCPLALDDPAFKEGTFGTSLDICFPDPQDDPGCKIGTCSKQRKGLCALPPSRAKR